MANKFLPMTADEYARLSWSTNQWFELFPINHSNHPLLLEAVLRFQNKAQGELFPKIKPLDKM